MAATISDKQFVNSLEKLKENVTNIEIDCIAITNHNLFDLQLFKAQIYNSTEKKLAAQWLNKALCFVSSFVVKDIFVLRNRQLLKLTNLYPACFKSLEIIVNKKSKTKFKHILNSYKIMQTTNSN